jgi:hypothetical protein
VIWTQTSHPSGGWDHAYGVAVDGTGVYVVGDDNSLGINWQWRIEKRSLTDGSVIWTQTSHPSDGWDHAYGVAVDGTGVYVVGDDNSLGINWQWRIEKRSLTDGSVIWTQTSNPSDGLDSAYGVAVDGTGVYVVGYDESPGNGQWRIEKYAR